METIVSYSATTGLTTGRLTTQSIVVQRVRFIHDGFEGLRFTTRSGMPQRSCATDLAAAAVEDNLICQSRRRRWGEGAVGLADALGRCGGTERASALGKNTLTTGQGFIGQGL